MEKSSGGIYSFNPSPNNSEEAIDFFLSLGKTNPQTIAECEALEKKATEVFNQINSNSFQTEIKMLEKKAESKKSNPEFVPILNDSINNSYYYEKLNTIKILYESCLKRLHKRETELKNSNAV